MVGVCTFLSASLLWSRTRNFPDDDEKKLSVGKPEQRMQQLEECIGHRADSESDAKIRTCNVGYVRGKEGDCVLCPEGMFSLFNWIACERFLDCEHVRHEATKGQLLHSLVHWKYFRADWKSYEIIYATYNPTMRTSIDYLRSRLFSPSHNFLYPIGYCEEEKVILFASNTTYLSTGNHLDVAFAKKPTCNNCMVRFHMVLNYVRILSRLHATDTVLCNSRILDHLLSQFLISENFILVLATLDNLPSEADGPILCQPSELTGQFVAPEQKWPHGSIKIFNLKEQPKYGKMSDIWKVPDVVSFFLKGPCDDILDYLQVVHMRCKSVNPHGRPLTDQLVEEYESVWKLLFGRVHSQVHM